MVIAFDSAPTITAGNSYSASNVATLTTASFTISGLSGRIIVAGAGSSAGTRQSVTSMRWPTSGGTDFTQVPTVSPFDLGGAQPFYRMSAWTLANPTSGSGTVTAVWASNQDETALGAMAFTGVDSIRAGANATGTTLTPTVNVTTVADDEVADVIFFGDVNNGARTLAAGAGQTSRQEVEGANLGFAGLGMSHETATGTTTTMSWTINNTINGAWGIIAIPMVPAADVTIVSGVAEAAGTSDASGVSPSNTQNLFYRRRR